MNCYKIANTTIELNTKNRDLKYISKKLFQKLLKQKPIIPNHYQFSILNLNNNISYGPIVVQQNGGNDTPPSTPQQPTQFSQSTPPTEIVNPANLQEEELTNANKLNHYITELEKYVTNFRKNKETLQYNLNELIKIQSTLKSITTLLKLNQNQKRGRNENHNQINYDLMYDEIIQKIGMLISYVKTNANKEIIKSLIKELQMYIETYKKKLIFNIKKAERNYVPNTIHYTPQHKTIQGEQTNTNQGAPTRRKINFQEK